MGDPGGILRAVRTAVDWGGVEQRAHAIVTALTRHDQATGVHAARVGQIAGAIAQELGSSADDVARARIAGLVHDAGKLHTPLSILAKPAALTDVERGVIQLHPLHTLEVATAYGIPDDVARAGALHHEMPSGRGYPFGLRDDEIPELTKIVSAADVFEALTGARPYRTPATPVAALEDLAGRVDRGELAGAPVAALERIVRRGGLPA